MSQGKRFSEKDKKEAFSSKGTDRIVQAVESTIKDPKERKEAVSIIRALDLKKIRNTSKT